MPGFPLAALGAGLGEWARNAQQQQLLQQNQQDQQLRRQLQMMQLQELLQGKQSARTAADAAAGFLTGGGGIGPVNPMAGGSGGPVGVPVGQAAPAALAFDSAFNAPPRPPLQPGVGGAVRSAGDAWLQQNAPFQTQGRASPQPDMNVAQMPWRSEPASPDAYAATAGSPGAMGTPVLASDRGKPVLGPDALPPPRAGANAPPAGIGAPPPEYDPATTAAAIKRAHPGISNQDLVAAVDLVGKELGPKVKGAYDRWKTQAELYYRGQDLAQRGQHHSEDLAQRGQIHSEDLAQRGQFHTDEMGDKTRRFLLDTDKFGFEKEDKALARGLEGRRVATGEAAQTESARRNVATEEEAKRQHDLAAKARDQAFAQKTKLAQGKTTAEIAELKTLANQARQLYAAVEQNPNLVGVRGRGLRTFGSVAEQAKWKQEDADAAELKSQIGLLQARLQKPLLGARYFSAKAQEQMAQLVPGLAAMDNPTAVKSALRNLAEQLEGKAGEIEATTKGVYGDANALTDDAIREGLKQMGIEPAH